MFQALSRQKGQALLAAIFFSLVILMIGSVLAQVGVRNRMQFTYSKQAYLAEQVAEAAVERGSATALYAYSNAPPYPPPNPCNTPVAPYSSINPCISPWGSANGGNTVTTYDYTDPNYYSGTTARTASITITDLSYNATTGTNKKPWIFKIEGVGKVPLAQTSAYGYTISGGQGYITRKVTRYIFVVEDLTFGLMSCGKVGFGNNCNGGGNARVDGNVGYGAGTSASPTLAECQTSMDSSHVPPPNKKRFPVCPPDVSASFLLDQNNFVGTDGKYTALVVNYPDSPDYSTSKDLNYYQTYVDQRIMALITPYIDPSPAAPTPVPGGTTYHYKASAMNNGQTPASGDVAIASVQDFGTGNTIRLRVTVPPGANGIALYRGTSSSNHTLVLQAAVPGGVSTTPKVVTITDTGGSGNNGFTVADLPADLLPPGLTDRVLLAALGVPGSDGRFDPWNNSVVAMIRDMYDIYYNSTVAYAAGVTVSSFTPATGTAGSTSVTISGSGFTGSQGSGSVRFNGTTASVSSWGASSITVTVPSGATTGPITVTNNSGVSGTSATSFCVSTGAPAPAISSMSPTSGTVGTVVTLNGTNFGSSTGTITFNGVQGVPSSWTDTQIVVPVPSGTTSGVVHITANCQTDSGSNTFTVTSGPPTTNSPLVQTCGSPGSSMTITGNNFGSSGTVKFDTATATTTSWNNTAITATVPSSLIPGSYTVTVTVGSNTSNGQLFTVPSTGPAITSLAPNSGNIGDLVTLTGTNFTTQQGGNGVTFNGTSAGISNWSDTSITTAVPAGATTGNVVATACSAASNGVTFTVGAPSPTPTPAPSGTPAPAPSPAANNTPPSSNTSKAIAQASPLGNFVRNVVPYLATTIGYDGSGNSYPVVPVILNIGGVDVQWNNNGSFNFALVNVGKITASGSPTVVNYWKGWNVGWPSNYGTTATCPACMTFSSYTNSSSTSSDTRLTGTPTMTSSALGLSMLLNNISGNGNFTAGSLGQGVLFYVTHNFNLSGNWTLYGSLMVASKDASDFFLIGMASITYDSTFVSKINSLLPGLLLPVQNLPMIVVRRALQSDWGN